MSDEREHVVSEGVKNCARCKRDHGNGEVVYEKLDHPIQVHAGDEIGTVTATHWAPCPTNGQPILMAFVAKTVTCDR